jgi:hypothetical protein
MRTLLRRRAFKLVVVLAATLAAARPQAGRAANDPAVKTAAQLDAEWTDVAAGLVRRCEAGGHDRLASVIGDWQLPDEGDRQFILSIPGAADAAPPDWIDTPAEVSIWQDFLQARRTRAAGTFALAVATSRMRDAPARDVGDVERPALEQGTAAAIRLLYRVLRDDPDHERAREAGGWVKRRGAWVWPEVARRLDKGEEPSGEFGWQPRGRPPRQPPDRDRQGRTYASDHWQITTTARAEAAAKLAQRLEETHGAWLQVFGAFQYEPDDWERRFEGRGRPRPLDPFVARLAASRQEYVAALEPLEPAIARTLGIYWTPTRTAWFFEAEGQEPTTVHHEATHQLFAEKRRTSPLAGERCGFWAIEAAACYMESLEPQPWGWTVGGRDAGRAAVARERLIDDGFHVPLAELTALGRRDFQADERLPQIYSEISGLADFFMNGREARYREAFLEYLSRIYTGTVDADTLSRLCRRSYADLDDDYRRHMAR